MMRKNIKEIEESYEGVIRGGEVESYEGVIRGGGGKL